MINKFINTVLIALACNISVTCQLKTSVTASLPESVGLSSDRLAKLDRQMHAFIDQGKLAGVQTAIVRKGELVHFNTYGHADLESKKALEDQSIWRIYSMTKPIVSVALMQLYEQGKFLLSDPVFLYLGDGWKKSNMRVYVSGDAKNYKTVPCAKNISVKHLLTHTSGLSYGFDAKGVMNKVDEIY